MKPDEMFAAFQKGVELLGGQRDTARALDINESTVRKLLGGTRVLHEGFMKDLAAALYNHGRDCLDLVKAIDGPEAEERTRG